MKATEEGKPASVKVSFKVKKTGKASKYSYVSKVNVVEDKYSIVSAEATGAKTITVTLNKAIADATAVKATVKKGATAKDSTFTAEGTKIIITTDTKLIAGSYNVTVSGLEATDLTATVEVAKDETLTTYEIGKELIADATTSTSGSIYYKALNQYGEMMTADAPQVTCSFTSVNPTVAVTATANREGRIDVVNINSSLAILGTKGTVVLVDQNLGVNATGEVAYSSAATAAEVKIEGMYNTAKSAFQEITAKDDADNYFLLMTITDQYGHQLGYNDIKNDVSITIAGGITNVESNATINSGDTAKGLKDFTIGGKDYIAAVLTDGGSLVKAGASTVTMVNNKRGLLLNYTIEVTDYIILSNFVVSADNGVYNNQDNEMSYEATDTNGNTITNYAVITKLVGLPNNQWKWQKNADGTAKLIYHPVVSITSNSSHTASTLVAAVFSCNETTSPNFKIKTQNFTIKQNREAVTVLGLASDAVTQFSSTVGTHKIDLNKIIYADQYANKVTKDDATIYPSDVVTNGAVAVGSCGAVIVTSAGMNAIISGSAFEFTSSTESATATIYLKLYNSIANDGRTPVSTTKYDYKFVVTCVDTQGVASSSIKISKVNSGNVEKVGPASYSAITVGDIEVTATVAGVDTKLDSSQYIIKSIENGGFTTEETNKGVKTKTATVTLQVTTFDNDNNPTITEVSADYQISYDSAYAYSVKDVSTAGKAAMASSSSAITVTSSGILSAQDMQAMFVFKDQYGDEMTLTNGTAVDSHIAYTITPKETTAVKVYGENGNKVYAAAASGQKYLLTITATPANGKATTKDIWVQF